ncbi:glucose 1-dehydrogenase [Paraburkholderia rhynchosiae]|uniref:3-alpha-(Or 20-beta)-hydroxysteroid dehydrogenase n=1 Tax=Paraburkholderia rhynchosiae TaxID=487049 RepID=A0A2N7W525_9BURK|nr:glucose 1-dehydrogenase [Paraburkholderia rhynchosiae]PMS24513.1 3-alpha-hydroxysteroid dehydrogenase [Paraburkholderia rhynchosiae]CAB3735806.1 3-alpha-(or 20-beta)-hydroxysteroid dehydrogenase [Paraburkholderia rhynchosiae]
MGRVSGKVAIVTGAARGMGAAHARRLIEEGAKVMLTDVLDAEGEETAASLGESARYLHHDVTKEDQWQRVVGETEEAFGPVSVLVNNAGIVAHSPIEVMEERDYRRVIDVNQVSVFLGMKSVIASMKRAGGGSIINISSVAGLFGAAEVLAYTASKFAVRGMSKSAAIELAPYNIRVNSVHPGLISTPMTVSTPESEASTAQFIAATPAGRPGEPDEVANVVLLLASDESRFSTGAEFIVDGGISCQ